MVAGTNWIVHFNVTFATCKSKLDVNANVFTPLPLPDAGLPVVNGFEVTRIKKLAPKTIPAWSAWL